jgi:predicted enzyme related to lactoylglutathione lyase
VITNLFTKDLTATRDLFVQLLRFEVEYESDWFISMVAPDGGKVAAMLQSSEFIPKVFQKRASGIMITVVVKDVEVEFARAKKLNLKLIEEPRDMPYGQRRMLIADASGALLDVSSPTAPLDPKYG